MRNMFMDTMTDWKDRVYEAVFAKKIEEENKKNFWMTMFIITASVLALVVAGFVAYTVLKEKYNNDIIARLKSHFCRVSDESDFVCEENEEISVEVVE